MSRIFTVVETGMPCAFFNQNLHLLPLIIIQIMLNKVLAQTGVFQTSYMTYLRPKKDSHILLHNLLQTHIIETNQ